MATRPPAAQLDAAFSAAVPYEFDGFVLAAYTDSRWFSSLTGEGPAAPLLELRRWPGDSILALYAIQGPIGTTRGGELPVPDADLTLQPGAAPDWAEWRGVLRGEAGDQPVVWSEQAIGDSPVLLGALLVPGDAGLGPGATADLVEELRAVLRRVVVKQDLWGRRPALAHGEEVELPELGPPPAAKSETTDPWQVALGSSFTLGLPPGLRAPRPSSR